MEGLEQIGTAEVLTFRTTRYDDPLKYPLDGLIRGTSVSHVALRMQFSKDALDPDKIERLRNLNTPERTIFKEATNGKGEPVYELYYSFWPKQGWSLSDGGSRLENHQYDSMQSELGTPFKFDPKFASLADTAKVSSPIPGLKHILPSWEITLPPSVTFHTDRFLNDLRIKHKMSDEQAASITNLAIDYTQKFEAWRDAGLTSDKVKQEQALNNLNVSREALSNALSPTKTLTLAEFADRIEPFFTFGLPERDSQSLPIINGSGGYGLQLDAMVDHILKIAESPKLHPYNAATNNCAHQVQEVLTKGARHSAEPFKAAISKPIPFINEYGLTLFPATVMQHAGAAALAIDDHKQLDRQDDLKPRHHLSHHPKPHPHAHTHAHKTKRDFANPLHLLPGSLLDMSNINQALSLFSKLINGEILINAQKSFLHGMQSQLQNLRLPSAGEVSQDMQLLVIGLAKLTVAAAAGAVQGTLSGGIANPPEKLAANAIAGASFGAATQLNKMMGGMTGYQRETGHAIDLAQNIYGMVANGKKPDPQVLNNSWQDLLKIEQSVQSSLSGGARSERKSGIHSPYEIPRLVPPTSGGAGTAAG